MLKNATNQDRDVQTADRRTSARVHLRSLAYVELDGDNGGLIINLSEGGIAVQSAETLVGDFFQSIRFRLPKSEKWIETSGKLVWVGKTRKEAGIRFLDLNIDAQQQIQSWTYSAARRGPPAEQGRSKILWEIEEVEEWASEPVNAGEASEYDSMFPSEKSLSPKTFPGLNKPASPDSAIGPGPVKQPERSPTTASSLGSYEPPLAPPVRRGELDTQQDFHESEKVIRSLVPEDAAPEQADDYAARQIANLARERQWADTTGDDVRRFREAFVKPGPRPDRKAPRRDPFASAVIDSPPTDFRASPPANTASATQIPAFPPTQVNRIGLGYQPAAFEEPSGKGWLIIGAILIALLGFGAALAIGPANVRALLSRRLSIASLAGAGPPPPAAASDKTSSQTNASDTPAATSGSMHLGGDSESVTNPDVDPESVGKAAPSEPASTTPAEGSSDARPPRGRIGQDTAELSSSEGNETPEIAAAKTRQFQLEHSQSTTAAPRTPIAAGSAPSREVPSPAASATAPGPIPAGNERTMDAYPQVPAAPGSTATGTAQAAQPTPGGGLAVPQAVALPVGTVAISSHFHSLRGEESLATLQDRPLQIGQLIAIHQPNYPTEAKRARVEGTVQLRATVDPVGRVEIVHVLSGPPILVPAAVEAVREWRYGPTILEGRAVESVNDVTVAFRLASSAPSPR